MKYEVTDAMVEAATTAYDDHCEDFDTETQDALDMHASAMRAAITAAIEASGLVEENARLREALIWIEDCCTITSASEYIHIIESCKAVAQREISKEPTR